MTTSTPSWCVYRSKLPLYYTTRSHLFTTQTIDTRSLSVIFCLCGHQQIIVWTHEPGSIPSELKALSDMHLCDIRTNVLLGFLFESYLFAMDNYELMERMTLYTKMKGMPAEGEEACYCKGERKRERE